MKPAAAPPPTRTHRQLAAWINGARLAYQGNPVAARVERSHSSTDRKIGRLRWPGKGRNGTRLEIYTTATGPMRIVTVVYRHDTSETYRRHDEARRWVIANLKER